MEPSEHSNLTGRKNAKSSAAPTRASTTTIVHTMRVKDPDTGKNQHKAVHHGCVFRRSHWRYISYYWKCEFEDCSATMQTEYDGRRHKFLFDKPHDEWAHMRVFRRLYENKSLRVGPPNNNSERKAASFADEPPETVNGDEQVPAKKFKGHQLTMASDRPHSQDTPPGEVEDAAGNNTKIESTKESGAENLVDSRAAADRRSPVHFQHPSGSNEPGTSALPSGDQGAQESEMLPLRTPPATADHAGTVQYVTDDGDESDCTSSDDSLNGDIGENPGADEHEAGDVNSRDAKAGSKGSLDPPSRKASYESMRNVRNAADDSAGIPLGMHGLGRSQTVLNMNPETGDLRENQLREKLLQQECDLVKARADLVDKKLKNEDLRNAILNKMLNSNMADNKTSERAAFCGLSGTE